MNIKRILAGVMLVTVITPGVVLSENTADATGRRPRQQQVQSSANNNNQMEVEGQQPDRVLTASRIPLFDQFWRDARETHDDFTSMVSIHSDGPKQTNEIRFDVFAVNFNVVNKSTSQVPLRVLIFRNGAVIDEFQLQPNQMRCTSTNGWSYGLRYTMDQANENIRYSMRIEPVGQGRCDALAVASDVFCYSDLFQRY